MRSDASGNDQREDRGPTRSLWFLLIAFVLLAATLRNQPWSRFSGYDQSKQAFVALEMVQEGSWFYQHLSTGNSATKPPLLGWISSAFYYLFGGWWEGAWRLPSFSAYFALLGIVAYAASTVGGGWGAFAAVGLLGFNMLSVRLATLIRTDMLLALCIIVAGLMIWRHVRSHEPWGFRHRLQFGLVILAGCMTKGPVILAFLLPAHASWWLIHRRAPPSYAWPGWGPWSWACAVFLLWLSIGCLVEPMMFEKIVLREFGTNFARIEVDSAGDLTVTSRDFGSLLSYPLQLLHRTFPWSIALVGCFLVDPTGRRRLMADPGTRWLLLWAGTSLLFMSLVPGKRVDRIYPIVPILAMISAAVVGHVASVPAQKPKLQRAIGWLTVVAAILWGGHAAYCLPRNGSDAERARQAFGRDVLAWERTHSRSVLVGPVTETDQSLALHLRRTRWIHADAVSDALLAGQPVVGPLNVFTNRPAHLVIVQSPVRPPATRYALAIWQPEE